MSMKACFALGLAVLVASCGEGGGGSGGPPYPPVGGNGGVQGERNFQRILARYSEGKVRRVPWAGPWWPYSESGIAFATPKLEAATGRGGATDWERSHHGPGLPGEQSWWGHCNGWAAAAVLFPEPRQPRSSGGQSFGVAEQKALLSEIGMEVRADFFGHREDDPSDRSSPVFQDVVPNQFLLVMANYVGQGFPVIIDRYTGYQVWNHPVAGYRMEPHGPEDDLGPDPSAPNVHRVRMGMTVWWVRNDVDAEHLTEEFRFADGDSFESRTLRFEVWLDGPPERGSVILSRQGNDVVGGAWRNGGESAANSHPDYMWIAYETTPSTGYSNPNVDARAVTRIAGGGG